MSRAWAALAVVVACFASTPVFAEPREVEREWYDQAKEALDAGDLATFKKLRQRLKAYPLAPYLDYRWFVRDLSERTATEFEAFDRQHRTLPFRGTVRSRYLLGLADRERWKDLLRVQKNRPRDEALRCVYYRAKLAAGATEEAWAGAAKLWRSGRSVSGRCDPLFEAWRAAGNRPDEVILERMLLAFRARQRGLIRYLLDDLTEAGRPRGRQIVDLYRDPSGVGAFAKKSRITDFNRTLAQHAFRRLARRAPETAIAQLDRVVTGQKLDDGQAQALAEEIASKLMSTDERQLQRYRDKVLRTSKSVRLLERRIREAMRRSDWRGVERWMRRLPSSARTSRTWTFWRGRLALKAGQRKAAIEILEPLLGQANYYSAAAATLLGRPIEYVSQATPTETVDISKYERALKRIQELVELKLVVDAKREWRYLLSRAPSRDQRLALAVFAHRSKWYHLTVQATIAAKLWRHMALRFPVAHQWWFDFFSKERNLAAHTMLAIARLESALNTQALSGAGARGLLQLLPSTAKEEARRLRFKYTGRDSLFDAGVNIRLGSSYLKRMLDRCDGNRIVAFASYNAGYTRVKGWRAVTDRKLDVYAWVEQIPFNETRGYVQNGLMFDIYYGRLMGKSVPLFSRAERRAKY